MKTQVSNIIRKSFIAISAMIMIGTTTTSAQERAGRNSAPAAARAAADTLKMDSAGIAKRQRQLNNSLEAAVEADVSKAEKDGKKENNGGAPDNNYKGFCPHEISFWLGGGFSSLNAYPTFGDRDYRFGGALGLGYSYHFNEHWSILTGAEIALYNMKMTVSGLTDTRDVMVDDQFPTLYQTNVLHYEEKDRMYALNIPLMLQYQTAINDRGHEFYAALGAKLGFPFSMKYKVKEADIQASGYYGQYNQWLYDQPDLGYGEHIGNIKQQALKTNVLNLIGTVEAGIKWNINHPKYNLYTGLYFDWGFTDLRKDEGTRFMDYSYEPEKKNEPVGFRLNSALASAYRKDGKTDLFADKLSTVSLGLKLRMGINTCQAEKAKRPKEDNNKNDTDPYRKGYRDAYNDLGEKEPRKQPRPATVTESQQPERKNAKPIDYTPAQERKEPYYTGDPLLEAEMKRASAEYGKLKDLLVLYIDGYEVNQSKLSATMEKMIDDKIKLLQKYNSENYIIIAEGHTCDLGREEFNMNLALKRAEVVREYLISKGFRADNLVAASKGETTPIVSNDSEANRKINRRVVFLIKEKH